MIILTTEGATICIMYIAHSKYKTLPMLNQRLPRYFTQHGSLVAVDETMARRLALQEPKTLYSQDKHDPGALAIFVLLTGFPIDI